MPRMRFRSQIQDIQDNLLKMSALTDEAIEKAVEALSKRDTDLAHKVIDGDIRINALENYIDSYCIRVFATQQPVAYDLRFLSSAMKINSSLERMADQAVNLSWRAITMSDFGYSDPPEVFWEMATIAREMGFRAMEAFTDQDADLAQEVRARDDALDERNTRLIREITSQPVSNEKQFRLGVEWIIAGRHLERVGDIATNIAEEAVFFIDGRVIRHSGLEQKAEAVFSMSAAPV